MDALKQLLIKANDAYHNGQPIMSDDRYDALVAQFEKETGTVWNQVGAPVKASNGTVVKLPMWMGSMNKVKEEKEIVSWQKRLNVDSVIITDKLDGISCLFAWYPASKQFQVFTRGNGAEGTDITSLVDYVPALMRLKTIVKSNDKPKWFFKSHLSYFIRGELVISKESWQKERETTWSRFANTRNTVSGLVNQKLSNATPESLCALSKLHFVPFSIDMFHTKKECWATMKKEKMFTFMRSLALPNVFYEIQSADTVHKVGLSKVLELRRKESPYDIDGIIVWDNTNSFEPNSSGNPSHAFAFKMVMDDQKAETLVTGVEWNVSRLGVWKPVVCFEPVTIGGTTIRRATGHNASWLVERKIGVGARILLVRSGDVIPKIHQVLHEVNPSSCLPFPPDGTWEWDRRRTEIMYKQKPTQTQSETADIPVETVATQSAYFVSTIKSKGLSSKTLEKFILRHKTPVYKLSFPHLFPLIATKEQWLDVESVKQKRADTFVDDTKTAWNRASVSVRFVASGLLPRGVGVKQIQAIEASEYAKHIIESLIGIKNENDRNLIGILCGIDGLGSIRADALVGVRSALMACERWLRSIGLSFVQQSSPQRTEVVSSTNVTNQPQFKHLLEEIGERSYFLMTGVRNAEWTAVLEQVYGKKAISGLAKKYTKDNTVVISGPKRSSKVTKAEQQGIKIILYEEL